MMFYIVLAVVFFVDYVFYIVLATVYLAVYVVQSFLSHQFLAVSERQADGASSGPARLEVSS